MFFFTLAQARGGLTRATGVTPMLPCPKRTLNLLVEMRGKWTRGERRYRSAPQGLDNGTAAKKDNCLENRG